MRALVTGASGFAGSLLVPRLRAEGHLVRALARDPSRLSRALAPVDASGGAHQVEVVRGDVLSGVGLERALADVEVAYYLIHSMERTAAGAAPFSEREQRAAELFARAAASAGVRRVVYLGGLQPDPRASQDRGAGRSRHLASRERVERILLAAVPDSVVLRASIVIGAHSRSFRLLVRLVERMPVLTLPAWRHHRTQPVDARDVTEMLAAAARAPVGGRALEAVGPDVISYGRMLTRIAELMLLRRPALGVRVGLTPLTARVAAAIAGEDPALVTALMEGLQGDLLSHGESAAPALGVHLHSFDAAVEHALREWEELEPLAAR